MSETYAIVILAAYVVLACHYVYEAIKVVLTLM